MMKKISITDIRGIRIGQTEEPKGATGCTVFLSKAGMKAGLDVRGGVMPSLWEMSAGKR